MKNSPELQRHISNCYSIPWFLQEEQLFGRRSNKRPCPQAVPSPSGKDQTLLREQQPIFPRPSVCQGVGGYPESCGHRPRSDWPGRWGSIYKKLSLSVRDSETPGCERLSPLTFPVLFETLLCVSLKGSYEILALCSMLSCLYFLIQRSNDPSQSFD